MVSAALQPMRRFVCVIGRFEAQTDLTAESTGFDYPLPNMTKRRHSTGGHCMTTMRDELSDFNAGLERSQRVRQLRAATAYVADEGATPSPGSSLTPVEDKSTEPDGPAGRARNSRDIIIKPAVGVQGRSRLRPGHTS